jgi:hypothetical protein
MVQAIKRYKKGQSDVSYEDGIVKDPILKKNLMSPKNLMIRYGVLFILLSALLYLVEILRLDEVHGFEIIFGMVFFFALNQLHRSIRMYFALPLNRTGAKGKVEYKTWYTLKMIATEEYVFAAFYLCLLLLTSSYIFLGGIAMSIIIGTRDNWSGNKLMHQTKR